MKPLIDREVWVLESDFSGRWTWLNAHRYENFAQEALKKAKEDFDKDVNFRVVRYVPEN